MNAISTRETPETAGLGRDIPKELRATGEFIKQWVDQRPDEGPGSFLVPRTVEIAEGTKVILAYNNHDNDEHNRGPEFFVTYEQETKPGCPIKTIYQWPEKQAAKPERQQWRMIDLEEEPARQEGKGFNETDMDIISEWVALAQEAANG